MWQTLASYCIFYSETSCSNYCSKLRHSKHSWKKIFFICCWSEPFSYIHSLRLFLSGKSLDFRWYNFITSSPLVQFVALSPHSKRLIITLIILNFQTDLMCASVRIVARLVCLFHRLWKTMDGVVPPTPAVWSVVKMYHFTGAAIRIFLEPESMQQWVVELRAQQFNKIK